MKTEKNKAETPAAVYPEADAEHIRKTFEDALEVHARMVYETLTDAERVHAVGLDDVDAYPSAPASVIADYVRFRAEAFQRGITSKQWESAKRKAFEKRMAEREILSVETFDPERKLSRMTNERGETVEVHADRPLTDRPAVRNDFEGVTHEQQGCVYVFTRWRMPSVSVADVDFYQWRELVEAAGLVLVGKGDEARYYLPRDVEEHRKRKAERVRTRERIGHEMEEDRKRKAAEREELERAAKVGRARMAYEAALAGAGVPVAPSASGDAVASTGPTATPAVPVVADVVTPAKKRRGSPGLSKEQIERRVAAAKKIIERVRRSAGERPDGITVQMIDEAVEHFIAKNAKDNADHPGRVTADFEPFNTARKRDKWAQAFAGVSFRTLCVSRDWRKHFTN